MSTHFCTAPNSKVFTMFMKEFARSWRVLLTKQLQIVRFKKFLTQLFLDDIFAECYQNCVKFKTIPGDLFIIQITSDYMIVFKTKCSNLLK